jgi:hypothetical protein
VSSDNKRSLFGCGHFSLSWFYILQILPAKGNKVWWLAQSLNLLTNEKRVNGPNQAINSEGTAS